MTVGGRAFSALAVQCTARSRGPRPRWVDIAEAVTGRAPYWPFNRDTTGAESLDVLAEGAAAYCRERGFRITREDRDGRLVSHVEAPAKGIVELTTDGEVFTVTSQVATGGMASPRTSTKDLTYYANSWPSSTHTTAPRRSRSWRRAGGVDPDPNCA